MPKLPTPEGWENPASEVEPGSETRRRLHNGDFVELYLERSPSGGRRLRLGAGPDPAPTAALEPEEAAQLALWVLRRLVGDDSLDARRAVEELRLYFDSVSRWDARYWFDAGG